MASADCQAHKMFPIKWAPLGLVVEPSRKPACSPKPETGLSGDGAGSSHELLETPLFCSEGISKPPSSHSPRVAGKGQRCLCGQRQCRVGPSAGAALPRALQLLPGHASGGSPAFGSEHGCKCRAALAKRRR